uniref:Uncharacterized protein LOC111123795 n=1 Tax=Crassostrea virginica TaxID=6565 RepID=A0A8B8D2W3_CRAVI|nr:uncharacterized protein LOC111123795 [Crassostrea virginica]
MNPKHSAQDVIRCDLCDTPVPPMHCDICHINLCKGCVVDHLSDESKDHKVVSFKKRGSTVNYPKCQKHSSRICEVHCKHCNTPICATCVSSGDHEQHKKIDILKNLTNKKDVIKKDLRELKRTVYPKYQVAASNISDQKSDLRKHSQKLISALDKQGKALHTTIDAIIKEMKSKIFDTDAHHLATIDKQGDGINQKITEIKQVILDLQNLLDSDDVCLVYGYTSRIEEFRSLPAQFHVTLPTFTPQEINREQISQQIGYLSKTLTFVHVARSFIDKPRILIDLNTDVGELRGVSCQSDNKMWTCGNDKFMRMFNLKGELLKSVETKSGNKPRDIAVTRSGYPMYIDYLDRSLNLVIDTKIQPLIRLQGWRPLALCGTSSDDLLIIMTSDDGKLTKVARFSGSTEKQSIQWDDENKPLYSSGGLFNYKYISENRNFDVCVADFNASAVVVVSAAGKLRFRYTGPTYTKRSFDPSGITTDGQGNIFTADSNNHTIHIINQDGHFLRYIDNCGLRSPWGLCVDSRDNLFVAEYISSKVKEIQCYK